MPSRTPYSAPRSDGDASAWSYLTAPPCNVSDSSLSARAASGSRRSAAAVGRIFFIGVLRYLVARPSRARCAVVKTVGSRGRHGLPGGRQGSAGRRAARGAAWAPSSWSCRRTWRDTSAGGTPGSSGERSPEDPGVPPAEVSRQVLLQLQLDGAHAAPLAARRPALPCLPPGRPCRPREPTVFTTAHRARDGRATRYRRTPMKKILPTAAALLLLPLAARAESELSLTLQGGAVKYDQALAAPSDLGAEYGVRLGILPTPVLGVEVGYLGSQSNVRDVVNNTSTTRFISNGAYADARVNVLPGNVMPYVFGGFGLTNFKVDNEVVSSDGGLHGKTVATIPFGGGVDFNLGAFKLGGRFQYNYLLTDQLVRTAPSGSGVTTGNNTNFYGVNLDLGVSFH